MQKTTTKPEIASAIEGVLIPAKSLAGRKKRELLLAQAQHNAAKIIKKAESDASNIRELAYCTGYQAGISMSINDIANYIDNSQEIYQQFVQKALEKMRENLKGVLDNECIFPALFSQWSEKIQLDPESSHNTLVLLIPKTTARHRTRLLSHIETVWHGPINIEQHDENRFMIKYKNQLAEFSPDIWISRQEFAAEDCLNLQTDIALLSREAIEQLIKQLAQHLIK